MLTPSPRKGRIFYGWWIVLACFLMFVYQGGTLFYSFGVFFTAIIDEFGWSRAATSVAFIFISLEGGAFAPVVGLLVDRFGPRKLMLIGCAIIGASFIALSLTNSLFYFYTMFVILAVGNSLSFCGAPAALANWFDKKRSRAMGIMMSGYGLSGALVPVVTWLVHQHGWRTTFVIAGIGTWLVCLPLASLVRHRPQQYGLLPDGAPHLAAVESRNFTTEAVGFTARKALRTAPFWLITISYTLGFLGLNACTVHLIPHLQDVGFSARVAALSITGMSLLSIAGRLGFGWLGDWFEKRYLIAICFGLQSVALLLLAYISQLWLLIPFLLFFGPAYGGSIPLRFSIQGDYFGEIAYATIMGLMWAGSTIGMVISPVFAGWIFDVMGSYRIAFIAIGVATAFGIPLVLAAKAPTLKDG